MHKCSPVCLLELLQGLTTDFVSLELTQSCQSSQYYWAGQTVHLGFSTLRENLNRVFGQPNVLVRASNLTSHLSSAIPSPGAR